MAAVRMLTLALAALVAFLMLAGRSDAVKCYNCPDCGDPFKSEGVPTCEDKFCVKTKATLSGSTTVTRSCSPIAVTSGCKSQSAGGASGTICTCSGDLCNSAPGLLQHAGMYALLATSAAVVLLAKLQD